MNDLFIINPQIATSLSNICLMDEETLEYSGLDYTITRNDHSIYELLPNGSNHNVTISNRVEYLRKTLQYYLCNREVNPFIIHTADIDTNNSSSSSSSSSSSAMTTTGGGGGGGGGGGTLALTSPTSGSPSFTGTTFNPLLSFLFGIQSICSRHYFHHFTPISLQLLLEGHRNEINVEEWKNNSEYRLQNNNFAFPTEYNPTVDNTDPNNNNSSNNIVDVNNIPNFDPSSSNNNLSDFNNINENNNNNTNINNTINNMTATHHHMSNINNQNNVVIDMFWEIVNEMSEIDRRKLLCFTIGTTSLPLNGFTDLQPKFTVVIGTLSPNSLPISHTCFHMLVLPKYETKEIMKEKLLQAIHETGISDLGIV